MWIDCIKCIFVVSGENSALLKEVEDLKELTNHLKEENNLLKLKIEILLDMVILLNLHKYRFIIY